MEETFFSIEQKGKEKKTHEKITYSFGVEWRKGESECFRACGAHTCKNMKVKIEKSKRLCHLKSLTSCYYVSCNDVFTRY